MYIYYTTKRKISTIRTKNTSTSYHSTWRFDPFLSSSAKISEENYATRYARCTGGERKKGRKWKRKREGGRGRERARSTLRGKKKETRRAREIFPRCGIKGAADYYGGNYRVHCVSGPGPRFAIESEQVGNAVLAVCAGPAGSLTDRPRLSTRLACRPRSTYGSSQVSLSLSFSLPLFDFPREPVCDFSF